MGKEMGWDGPCVGGQKEEKEEKRRAPSFNPVDLGRAWQATSDKPTLGDLTNGSTTSFFGRVQCVHRPAQPASLAWQPRQAHCEKKIRPVFGSHQQCLRANGAGEMSRGGSWCSGLCGAGVVCASCPQKKTDGAPTVQDGRAVF